MGIVFRAYDTLRGCYAALKYPSLKTRGEFSRVRFLREAESAARVQHPNVCAVFGIGQDHDQPFVVMEYLEGETLASEAHSGGLPVSKALGIALDVARGLAAVHQAGVVHRDIKPANVMLTGDRGAVIFDFGLACEPGSVRITGADAIAGTLAFMSPEQALGQPFDFHTDIWSAGVLLYSMLTGRLPFGSVHEEIILYSLINESPATLPHCGRTAVVDKLLSHMIVRSLAKQPSRRYPSDRAFAGDLETTLRLELGDTCLINHTECENTNIAGADG